MDDQRKTSRMALVGVVALSALLAGCSASGDTASSGSPSQQQHTPATSSAASTTQGRGSAQAVPSTAQTLGDLGTRAVGGEKGATVTLNSVTANDGTMTVNFSLTNRGDHTLTTSTMFDNGLRDPGKDGAKALDEEYYSADGVYVITSEKKRYLVGRGDNGVCACSSALSGATVGTGQTMTFSAVFAAPPEAIDTVDVFIPTAGTFENVSLARS